MPASAAGGGIAPADGAGAGAPSGAGPRVGVTAIGGGVSIGSIADCPIGMSGEGEGSMVKD